MNKYLNIIALENPNNPFEAEFYTKLKTYYSDLFSIYIIDAIEKVKVPFDAIFSFTPIETLDKPHLLFSHQLGSSDSFYVNQEILDSADTILRLSRYLNNFYQKYSSSCLQDFLYQLRISDKDGTISPFTTNNLMEHFFQIKQVDLNLGFTSNYLTLKEQIVNTFSCLLLLLTIFTFSPIMPLETIKNITWVALISFKI
ncbi:hypothetical protein ABG751_04775 [Streptococcus iniae]